MSADFLARHGFGAARAEALPADLGAAVDSFGETFADHCDDEDRAVLARAAQILKTEPASPGTDESEA